MSETVRDMIGAVVDQDAAAFLDSFETAINAKVAAKLDAIYPEVAHAVMNPQEYEVSDTSEVPDTSEVSQEEE